MDIFLKILNMTGFANIQFGNLIMIVIGLLAIYVAIAKKYEPLLLLPIGFGIIIGNIPSVPTVPIGVFDTIANGASSNSVFSMIYWCVTSGLFPPLIFLGIGALTDFSSLISNPKSIAWRRAQLAFCTSSRPDSRIFCSRSCVDRIIGGADGPTSIFCLQLGPQLLVRCDCVFRYCLVHLFNRRS
jgi:oxaloacetate decarboxylase beta subunit